MRFEMKKKLLFIVCSVLLLTACGDKKKESGSAAADSSISSESTAESSEKGNAVLPDRDDNEPGGEVPDDPTKVPENSPEPTKEPEKTPTPTETATPVPTETPSPTPEEVTETPTPTPESVPTSEPDDVIPVSDDDPEIEEFEIGVYTEEHSMMIYRGIPGYSEYKMSDEPDSVEVIFAGPGPVHDFQILKLEDMDFDNGKTTYKSSVVYEVKVIDGEHPLGVTLPAMEDIPKVGISFVDESGKRFTYAVARGGADDVIFLASL